MTSYEIKRWDAVISNNSLTQSPMLYIVPDIYLLEFIKSNKFSLFCQIYETESSYDNLLIPCSANKSSDTPNCRPNYFVETNTYVITLDTNWIGYPNKLGKVIFSGYKNNKSQI